MIFLFLEFSYFIDTSVQFRKLVKLAQVFLFVCSAGILSRLKPRLT
jgi:hypothetical protein